MWQRKTRERLPIRSELEEIGVTHTPIIWTHHERPHEQAQTAILGIARAVARRRGGGAAAVESGIRGRIETAIARRSGRMSLACTPRHDGGGGGSDDDGGEDTGPWRELPPIHDGREGSTTYCSGSGGGSDSEDGDGGETMEAEHGEYADDG